MPRSTQPIASLVLSLVVAAALVSGCTHSSPVRSRSTPPTASSQSHPPAVDPALPTFGPSGTLGSSSDPKFAEALQAVQAELSAVAIPPGATRVSAVPSPALSQPSSWTACPGLVDRAGFWTAPGTIATAIAYARAHPPAQLAYAGGSSGTTHGVYDQSVSFGNIAHADDLEVQVAVTSLHTGVALRVDVQSVWNYPYGCMSGSNG